MSCRNSTELSPCKAWRISCATSFFNLFLFSFSFLNILIYLASMMRYQGVQNTHQFLGRKNKNLKGKKYDDRKLLFLLYLLFFYFLKFSHFFFPSYYFFSLTLSLPQMRCDEAGEPKEEEWKSHEALMWINKLFSGLCFWMVYW